MDDRGVPGYGKLCALANELCSVHQQVTPLTNNQVQKISQLHDNLHDCDKAKVKYTPRHKDRLNTNSCKRNMSSCVPGVESMAR